MIKITTLSTFRISILFKVIRTCIVFLIYSHIFIGLCAAASVLLTRHILKEALTPIPKWDVLFIGSATIITYALHRYISSKSLKLSYWPKRFVEIERFVKVKLAIVFIAGLICLFSFLQLNSTVQYLLFIPIFLTALYIFPVFKGMRLRDVAYVKIFILALVWSWLTVIIPTKTLLLEVDNNIKILFVERVLFIIAITIPFDIRDIHTDRSTRLTTLITRLGTKFSKYLAVSFLCIAFILDLYLLKVQFINIHILLGFIVTYFLCILLIIRSSPQKDDSYFTGWIDGTMILLLILVLAFDQYLS